jgi:superfamily I DNA/RNA helicase/PHP family Zn ribbon phosphoesterase
MRLVADLHIHSRHSLATSPKLTPPGLERWACIKGIDLLGTGDCTHPAWLSELRASLEPAEEGLFRLKDEARRDFDRGEALADGLPEPAAREMRFVLSGEISTIYSRGGRTRKVHHLVLLPGFEAAAAFQSRLERVGNIASDGRPILGIDSRDLFSLLLDADERALLVPAHIWTPWFSALGARSGFDSIEECYGDLASRIPAIETGLSSNPPMNWAVSALDRFSVISNSDAHSPEKLGREATILEAEPSFAGLAAALSPGPAGIAPGILGTIEFFPQEGKYHWDGHRACGIVLSPEESAQRGGLCPVCGKALTPGVLRRVAELADRPVDESAPCPAAAAVASSDVAVPAGGPSNRRPYHSLIPLKEVLSELLDSGEGSKKVAAAYGALIAKAGSEFALLLGLPVEEVGTLSVPGVPGELLALAVERMRAGKVSITPGYDGEYGVIRAFAPGARPLSGAGASLFASADAGDDAAARSPAPKRAQARAGGHRVVRNQAAPVTGATDADAALRTFHLDPAQEEAVAHGHGPALVLAGPGTGKTAVLALRIERLVGAGLEPASVLALTFTNRAAGELRGRIGRSLGEAGAATVVAGTFHAFCKGLLRDHAAEAGLQGGFSLLDGDGRSGVLEAVAGSRAKAGRLGTYIEARKRFLLLPGEAAPRLGPAAPAGLAELAADLGPPQADAALEEGYANYREALRRGALLDFDDLVAGAVRLLCARPDLLASSRGRHRAVFVDEYQDVNFAQYALVRLLAPPGADLFAIGDPNQSIYGFRGSDPLFISRFTVDWPEARVYRLERSFRCAAPIIEAAGRLVDARLVSSGAAVALATTSYPTGRSEAEGIAREIDRLIAGTRFFARDSGIVVGDGEPGLQGLGECAILVRTASLMPDIAKALFDHGLPCEVAGERPWWEEEPDRSALALLRAAACPGEAMPTAPRAAKVPGNVQQAALADFRVKLPGLLPAEAVKAAFALFASPAIGGATDVTAATAREAMDRLAARAASFSTTPEFLDALALASPQDGLEPRTEKVPLLTIHAAKGLEFDHVFVAGLEEGILPFTLFDDPGDGAEGDAAGGSGGLEGRIEEERRLLYVAMTRARVGLHLSWARSRSFRGREVAFPPSRFLAELADLVPETAAAPPRPRDPQLGLF